MKRLFKHISTLMMAVVLSFGFSSCDNQEDNLTDLGTRLDALEAQADLLNQQITTLSQLIQAIQDNTDYVTSVTETDDGWMITFEKMGNVLIKPGKNGQNGHTPVIGVKKGDDNKFYWTVDGEWMRDGQGNLIAANGIDGQDATDMPLIPQVRINPQTRIWEISYDGGKSWVSLNCKADGTDGVDNNVYLFKEVIVNAENDYVTIVMADGTTQFILPLK